MIPGSEPGSAPFGRPAVFPPPDRVVRVAVPGGRAHVRINGALKGPRPPIVMVHGGPGGTHAGFLDALALARSEEHTSELQSH